MNESIKEKIIGTWKLVSWVYKNEKGETFDYFGETPVGILMYDRNGYMNAQLMKNDRKNFTSVASIATGNKEEIAEAYKSYAAYFGKYYERSPGELIHTVEGSLFPNWVGNDEVRYGKVVDDFLILSAPPVKTENGEIVFFVTWKRA